MFFLFCLCHKLPVVNCPLKQMILSMHATQNEKDALTLESIINIVLLLLERLTPFPSKQHDQNRNQGKNSKS